MERDRSICCNGSTEFSSPSWKTSNVFNDIHFGGIESSFNEFLPSFPHRSFPNENQLVIKANQNKVRQNPVKLGNWCLTIY